jgi:hypothetical protein
LLGESQKPVLSTKDEQQLLAPPGPGNSPLGMHVPEAEPEDALVPLLADTPPVELAPVTALAVLLEPIVAPEEEAVAAVLPAAPVCRPVLLAAPVVPPEEGCPAGELLQPASTRAAIIGRRRMRTSIPSAKTMQVGTPQRLGSMPELEGPAHPGPLNRLHRRR